MEKTLEPKINLGVVHNPDHPAVKSAVKLIADNNPLKTRRDAKNQIIKELFKMGFTVSSPDGLRKIHSKMFIQAFLKVMSRLKPIDAQIHGVGVKPYMETIVTAAVRTIADRGGFDTALRDKGGAFWNALMFGDAFTLMMGNPDDKSSIPFVFDSLDNSNIYVNANALAMRSGRGKSVTQMLIVIPFKWSEFIAEFPDAETKSGAGRLPTNLDSLAATSYSSETEIKEDDIVEVGYFFDIANRNYTIMSGSAMTVLDEYWHDDYPFEKDGEAYIPVMQHVCIPAAEDFWNFGLGDYLYELALISQQLLNMGTIGALNEALPIDVVSIPKQKASSFFNQMLSAHEMRMQGKRPYVAIEYDPNTGSGSNAVSTTTLQTQLGNRWAELIGMIEKELQKIGINLYESQYEPGATATEVLSVEQAQLSFVKQMQEFNATEYQFFYEVMLDMIRDFIDINDDTPLNLAVTIQDDEGQPVKIDNITLGMVADELKKRNYYVKVNSRSGAIPSGVMQQTQLIQTLQSTPPGTPAYFKLLKEFANTNDQDFSLEDFGFQGAQPQQGGGNATPPEGIIPSDTERNAINPRSKVPSPAML